MNRNKELNDKRMKRRSGLGAIPSQLVIQFANKCENPLLKIDINFHSYKSNELDLRLTCNQWQQLSEECQQWIIGLIENNMKGFYESSSWGWKRSNKLKELKHKTSRILILKCIKTEQLIAFVNFRFEKGSNDSESAVYCYEIQIIESHRRHGIGSYLMSCLKQMAISFNTNKVMLTVFKNNTIAMDFYMNGLKYRIDRSSPSRFGQESDYEILSIKIDKRNSN